MEQLNKAQIIQHIADLIQDDMPTQLIRDIITERYSISNEQYTELFSIAFTI